LINDGCEALNINSYQMHLLKMCAGTTRIWGFFITTVGSR